jgi:hypothetical protein
MAVRRFGPVLGAGVQIEEKEGTPTIQQAPLGVTVLVSEFPKGPVGEPGFPAGVLDHKKRYGARLLPTCDGPKAAQDFYKLGRGAGELIPFRVTAGDEAKAALTLYTRQGATAAVTEGIVSGLVVGVPTTPSAQLAGTGATSWRVNLALGRYYVGGRGFDTAGLVDFPVHSATCLLANGQSVYAFLVAFAVGGAGSIVAVKGTPALTGAEVVPSDAAITAAVGTSRWIKLSKLRLSRTGDLVLAQTQDNTVAPAFAHGTSGRAVLGVLRAKSGGAAGGQRKLHVDEITSVGDLTATTLDTGDVMIENEWAGGTLQLKRVTTKTYKIVGNTALGVISVAGDQTLQRDFLNHAGTPANRYVLSRENVDPWRQDQHLAATITNGQENPTTEFGISVYEDGALAKSWENLSTDPTKPNYWVNVVNKDKSNFWVEAVDQYTGDKSVAAVRPANLHGVSGSLTSVTLALPDPDVTVDGSANPKVEVLLGSLVRSQTLVGEVENGGADIAWTTSLGPLEVVQTGFDGVTTDLGAELAAVRVTNGTLPLSDGDKIYVEILALEPDEAKGGKLWPDLAGHANLSFAIASNTRTTVTVRTGLDLTVGGTVAAGAPFRLEYPQEFGGGHNGSPVTDLDYLAAFDAATTKLRRLFGRNKGFVKMATPGLCSTAVAKAALECAAALNYGYLVEVPANIVTEAEAVDYINTTIGRSDYGFAYFPSFGSVLDPHATPGAANVPLRQQSLAGMILGRHALVAKDYKGYHKAPADVALTLPDVLELPTGDAETAEPLNEEVTNPQGLNLVKFRQGSVILWGDRTISPTSEWRWLHQRCQMSHYENLLREQFDWIVWAINDEVAQHRVGPVLRAFFLPEWTKRALRGKKFDGDAFVLKLDQENNTDATRAEGDLNAEISLRLADTIERFRVRIGKLGIFDAVG